MSKTQLLDQIALTWRDIHLPTTAVYEQLVDKTGCTGHSMRQGYLQVCLDNRVTLSWLAVTKKCSGHCNLSLLASVKLVILNWKQSSRTNATQFTKKICIVLLLYFCPTLEVHKKWLAYWQATSNGYLLSLCFSLSFRGTQMSASHLSSCQVFTIVGGAESCSAISSSVVFG